MLKKREPESKVNASSLHRSKVEKNPVVPVQRTEKPPSYLYPLQKPAYIIPASKSSREFGDSDNETTDSPPKEEEIKPKLVRPRNLDAHFKQILSERYSDEKDNDVDQQFSNDERFFKNDSFQYDRSMDKKKVHANSNQKHVQRTKSVPTKDVDEPEDEHRYRYHESKGGYNNSSERLRKSRDSFEDGSKHEYSENLTDKQKYHQSLMKKQQNTREYYDDGFRPKENSNRSEIKSLHRNDAIKSTKPYYDMDERTIDNKKYRYKGKMPAPGYDDDFEQRNPYKEPEILPYREKNECIKSPVMRYKSYDDSEYRDNEYDNECTSDCEKDFAPHSYPSKYRGMYEPNENSGNRQRYRDMKRGSPDQMHDAPKERYHHSNENFRQMDRERYRHDRQDIDRPHPMEKTKHSRRMIPMPRPDFDMIPPPPPPPKHYPPRHQNSVSVDVWSSDEEFGRSSPSNVRIIPREHYEKNSASRMAPSKSLGNLAKGYRHSYAEPPSRPNQMPRNGGRVGLAAVQPY